MLAGLITSKRGHCQKTQGIREAQSPMAAKTGKKRPHTRGGRTAAKNRKHHWDRKGSDEGRIYHEFLVSDFWGSGDLGREGTGGGKWEKKKEKGVLSSVPQGFFLIRGKCGILPGRTW